MIDAVSVAPAWVWVRGLARESGHWGDFPERLRARTGRAVVCVDLPGTGDFRDVAAPTTMTANAEFVRTQARARVDGPVRLLTISLGAMVGFEWARLYPEEVRGCVVLNTSAGNVSRFYDRLRWQIWPRFGRALTIPTPRERERELVELTINDPDARSRALTLWTKLAVERPISYRTFLNQLWAASRAHVAIPGRVPGLILNGLGDRLVDPSCSTALARHTRWPLRRHAWAGHDLTWDDPEWVIDQILAWGE